jgi:DNA polymerase I-like protein with 3'-5' exonuclease and polymerase domains
MRYYFGPRPRVHYIVRGPDGIQDVLNRLRRGILAVDTETTGLDWSVDRVGALCLAAGDTSAFFCQDALGTAARWLGDQVVDRRKLVFHHGKFDMHMMRETFGLHIPYPVHDTLLMSQLIDNRGAPIDPPRYPFYRGHSLKDLATAFVDPDAHAAEQRLLMSIQARTGKRGKDAIKDWLIVPMKVAGKYGGRDPWYTLMLYDQFIDRIRHWPQPEDYPSLMELYETERWLLLALRDMEERGMMIDQDFLDWWMRKSARQMEKARRRLNRLADEYSTTPLPIEELNWNSNPQVSALLFDSIGIEEVIGRSTAKRPLLRMKHPLANALLRYRSYAKSEGTFGKSLKKFIKTDGAVHTRFNQNVATGRMSAMEPPLHQQKRGEPGGRGVRTAFVPRKGMVLRSADYSQIEMRFAAHFSNEQVLVDGFNNDPKFDTHAALARRMFGLGKHAPSEPQRSHGKTMNFSMIYGSGIDAVTESLIDKITEQEARVSCLELGYRPSRSESTHHALAELLRGAVRESYPRIWKFTKDEEEIALARGFVVDAYGYHRYLDEDNAYKAMNSKVQGSAAHAAKKGLVNVYRELQLGTGELAILLQVHDDIIYESEGDPQTDKRVLELLEDRTSFRVPIVSDLKGSATNWQDKVSIKLKGRVA